MIQDKPSDIVSLSATELARRIRAGELSAREVVEAHINRIEYVNKHLNAVVVPTFDEALSHAKAADEQQAQGKPLGPLHGVPVTIKEQFQVIWVRKQPWVSNVWSVTRQRKKDHWSRD